MHYGAQAVSSAELLAIIIRTGSGGENVLRLAETAAGRIRWSEWCCQSIPHRITTSERHRVRPKAVEIKAALSIWAAACLLPRLPGNDLSSPAGRRCNLLMSKSSLLEKSTCASFLLDTRNRALSARQPSMSAVELVCCAH